MRKILSITITMLLLLSITACGSVGDPDDAGNLNVSVNGEKTEDDQTPDVDVNTDVPSNQDITIQETVLLDEANIKITAKSFTEDSFFGKGIKLLIENNSDKDLTVQCRNSSVNGYMVDTMLSADVVSGKKANDSLIFADSDLEACGITTIADMEFSFHIFDSETWDDYLDTAQIQLKTSAAENYTYTYDDSGSLAYDGNNIKIIVKGIAEDSIFGPGITVYIENNGDKDITVQTRDVSINGFMVDAMFSCDVCVGKRAVDSITFLSSELEENEITQIETVELSFHVFSFSDWETIVDTDTVTISY